MSNLKLQKLLYLIQAYFLLNNSDVCFREEIRAWDFGPVVPSVYNEFKVYGVGDIPKSDSIADTITLKDKKLISDVVEYFKDYSSTDLVTLTTHQEPWEQAWRSEKGSVISITSIREYFSEP